MDIQLPPDLETFLRGEVADGRFSTEAVAVTAILREYVERRLQGLANEPPAADPPSPPGRDRPVWERILDRAASIPDEEWDRIPADLAEQHDHYLYGTAKRPTP